VAERFGWIKMKLAVLHCVRWGPSSHHRKRYSSSPTFEIYGRQACAHIIRGPCLLWPNGSMDQDAIWCGGRPQPTNIVLDGDPAPPLKKGHNSPNFRPIYYGQTAGLIMMKLGAEVGLGPGYTVLDGDPAPRPPRSTALPNFGLCLL